METEVRIQVPEGMEIDKENSTFECIKFKPKNVTYDDILKSVVPYTQIVNTTLRHQQKCITFRKLLEVADYLNGDWKPAWDNKEQHKYIIYYNNESKQFGSDFYSYTSMTPIVFPSRENAKKAVEIIGEEELKNFFSNNMVY